MTALLTGLWVAWLFVSLVQVCRRRTVPVVYVPVVIVLPTPPAGEQASDHEAWLRRQLDGLGHDGVGR